MRIVTTPELEKFITRQSDKKIKLTSTLLLLRKPERSATFDAIAAADKMRAAAKVDADKNKVKDAKENLKDVKNVTSWSWKH